MSQVLAVLSDDIAVEVAPAVVLSNCDLQVQNMSQSIEVLDQRTQRDLQFVEKMEVQLKSLENKFKQVEDGHETNIARQYKVAFPPV